MTEALQVALVVAVPGTLTGLAGLIIAVKSLRVGTATHDLSNSKFDKLTGKLETALGRIGYLERLLETAEDSRAALLARARLNQDFTE